MQEKILFSENSLVWKYILIWETRSGKFDEVFCGFVGELVIILRFSESDIKGTEKPTVHTFNKLKTSQIIFTQSTVVASEKKSQSPKDYHILRFPISISLTYHNPLKWENSSDSR